MQSFLDVGLEPLRGRRLTAQDRVRIVQQLETMLGAHSVDLVILPEAGAFLATDLRQVRDVITAWLWAEDRKAVAGLPDKERSRPIVVAV